MNSYSILAYIAQEKRVDFSPVVLLVLVASPIVPLNDQVSACYSTHANFVTNSSLRGSNARRAALLSASMQSHGHYHQGKAFRRASRRVAAATFALLQQFNLA